MRKKEFKCYATYEDRHRCGVMCSKVCRFAPNGYDDQLKKADEMSKRVMFPKSIGGNTQLILNEIRIGGIYSNAIEEDYVKAINKVKRGKK